MPLNVSISAESGGLVTLVLLDQNLPPIAPSINGATNGLIAASVVENTTAVATISATNLNGSGTLAWSITTYRPDYALFSINSATGAVAFLSAPDYETPLDYVGTYGPDGVTYTADNGYWIRVSCTHVESGLSAQVDLNVTVTIGAGIPAPAFTITPLASNDFNWKTLYDSKVATWAATRTAELNDVHPEECAYKGMYWIKGDLDMYIATGDTTYLNNALTAAETVLALATIQDDDGLYNFGANGAGDGITTYTALGNYSAPGTKVGYLLYDAQFGSQAALVAAVIKNTPSLTSYVARGDAVYAFVKNNIMQKWHNRGSGTIVTGTLDYLEDDPLYTGGGQDQALHIAVMAAALNWHTASATYAAWALNAAGNLVGRLRDSAFVTPLTPTAGAKYVITSHTDTSHNNRYPYGLRWLWLLGYAGTTEAVLADVGKHFESMLWNQSTTEPAFSSDYLGGDPVDSNEFSVIGHGWVDTGAALAAARTLLGYINTEIDGGGTIQGTTNHHSLALCAIAAEMSSRAISASAV